MPTSSRNERTRAGCWTCRARRKKCDETRPQCTTCYKLGLECEGYGLRLKWSEPRAKPLMICSQGGKDKIAETLLPSTQTSDGDNYSSKDSRVLEYHLGKELYQSLAHVDREIMRSFIDWGAVVLIARVKIHPEKYFEIFSQSKSLLYSCLAYQVMLEQKYAPLVEQYYIRSIEQFRREIASPACVQREATIYSGLVLCSISMTRGIPWTFHLNGVSSLLGGNRRSDHDLKGDQSKDYVFFMGVLDLPTHTLGRRTNYLGIWNRSCRLRSGIEDSLGLPCSLVDLLCLVMEPEAVTRLASWPGEIGTWEQCQLWDMTRHAGIVAAHNYRSSRGIARSDEVEESIAFAVRHIMTTTRDIRTQLGQFSYQPWSGLLFSLVTAGSQPVHLNEADQTLITDSIKDFASGSLEQYPYYNNVVEALRKFWSIGGSRSLEEVVVDLDMELGLF